ncbi:hypothetical protein KKH36_00125 [Patescibacteria group bacterium]|nr:hypothetical protein [Patescibacteria group bacterium]
MQKTKFLTIYPSFENLEVVKKTLPSVIEETKKNDAKLIVHDSSIKNKEEKWNWLQELNKNNDFFLILSNNISMAHARNMCLQLGQELYAPEYICMIEDDHGFKEGLIQNITKAMQKYYGEISPNGLRYGLFSACTKHLHAKKLLKLKDGNSYPDKKSIPIGIGGSNSCFRCAPTSHWNNVLKGYDTDEYLISTFQTKNLNFRNYNKGFTTMFIQEGKYTYDIEAIGRGMTTNESLKLWDETYTASDHRSIFLHKDISTKQFKKITNNIKENISLVQKIFKKITKNEEKIKK